MGTPIKKPTTAANQIKILKLNTKLFTQALLALIDRQISLKLLYSFEFYRFPPAISIFGDPNLPGNKSHLITQIVTPCHSAPENPECDISKSMLIIDGGNLPYNHAPKTAMTFLEYGDQIFKKILNHCDNYQRVVIFDIYQPNSLKAATREKRGRVSKKECLKMQNVHQTGKAF